MLLSNQQQSLDWKAISDSDILPNCDFLHLYYLHKRTCTTSMQMFTHVLNERSQQTFLHLIRCFNFRLFSSEMPQYNTAYRRNLLPPPRRLQVHPVCCGGHSLRAELSRGYDMEREREEVPVSVRQPRPATHVVEGRG